MRKILGIFIALSLLVSVDIFAQATISGNYKSTPEINKFEGKWSAKIGTDRITLDLKVQKNTFLKDLKEYKDFITGSVIYEQNGIIVYSNDKGIINGLSGPGMPYSLWATFNDPGGRNGRMFFDFKDMNDLGNLTLKVVPKYYTDRFNKKMGELKIPENMVLVRIK